MGLKKTNVKVFFSANENDYVDGTVLVYDKQVDIAVIGFTTTKNIGGNEYKAFGDTEALDKFSKGIAENKTKLMKNLYLRVKI